MVFPVFAQPWLRVDRPNAHLTHQPAAPLSAHSEAQVGQFHNHLP